LTAARKVAALAEENKEIGKNQPKMDYSLPNADVLNGYLHVIARLLYQVMSPIDSSPLMLCLCNHLYACMSDWFDDSPLRASLQC
jgi:hypothetical protein